MKENNKFLNNNIIANMLNQGVSNWFSLRLSFLTICIFAFSASFCIVYRSSGNEVMLSMMLSYILSLQYMSIATVKLIAMLE